MRKGPFLHWKVSAIHPIIIFFMTQNMKWQLSSDNEILYYEGQLVLFAPLISKGPEVATAILGKDLMWLLQF